MPYVPSGSNRKKPTNQPTDSWMPKSRWIWALLYITAVYNPLIMFISFQVANAFSRFTVILHVYAHSLILWGGCGNLRWYPGIFFEEIRNTKIFSKNRQCARYQEYEAGVLTNRDKYTTAQGITSFLWMTLTMFSRDHFAWLLCSCELNCMKFGSRPPVDNFHERHYACYFLEYFFLRYLTTVSVSKIYSVGYDKW
jgi:hypothetical protein